MLIKRVTGVIRRKAVADSGSMLDAIALPGQFLRLGAIGAGIFLVWRWMAGMHPPLLLDRFFLVAGSVVELKLVARVGGVFLGPWTVWVGSLLDGLAGPSVYFAHPRTITGHILRWVIGSGTALIVVSIQRGEAEETQKRSDQAASDILARPRTGGYWLYLRPFTTDGRLPVQLSGAETPGQMNDNAPYVDLQTVLRGAAPPGAEFIAIGQPGKVITGDSRQIGFTADSLELGTSAAVGAGKAQIAEAEWKPTVRTTAEGADLILVVPLNYRGTRWEVQMIRGRGYLDKTVFIMPESLVGAAWKSQWVEAQVSYARKGFTLPPYREAGMLFMMSDDGTMKAGYSLRASLGRVYRVRRLLRHLGVRR